MYRDPERKLYDMFGLERSIEGVWNLENIWWVASVKAAGRLPNLSSEDDPHQKGGDVVLDENGSVLLHYATKEPNDRPSIDKLLEYCV